MLQLFSAKADLRPLRLLLLVLAVPADPNVRSLRMDPFFELAEMRRLARVDVSCCSSAVVLLLVVVLQTLRFFFLELAMATASSASSSAASAAPVSPIK